MNYPTRTILIATLILGIAGNAAAQETATAAEETTTSTTETAVESSGETTTAVETSTEEESAPRSSYEIRNEFSNVLRGAPSEVASILVLDPTLLSNEAFISGYPAIADYLQRHPEIRRNPRYYLAQFATPPRDSSADEVMETFAIILTFGGIALVFTWLVRTTIEQKRWNRLSRQQSEVHNKILDRFGTSSELLEYVKTPAGTKFLESAPIPLHAEKPAPNRPLARVVWSIQIGVIVAAAALGMLIVSLTLDHGDGLFAMGAILLSIGLGFIGSAAVSLLVSRKLGLWDDAPSTVGSEQVADPGHVR